MKNHLDSYMIIRNGNVLLNKNLVCNQGDFSMKRKKIWIIPLIVSILSLVIGASFHGYRLHPENVQNYNISVIMGISMVSIAGISFVTFVIMLLIYKKRK